MYVHKDAAKKDDGPDVVNVFKWPRLDTVRLLASESRAVLIAMLYLRRRNRSSYISVSSTGTPESEKKTKKAKKEVKKQTVKYNAAKLHEKGIVLEIDGCSPGQ